MRELITIKEEVINTPDAVHLIDELSDILESMTGSSGRSSFNTSDVFEERAVFVIARNQDGEAVGCGAIRQIDENTAEVKRMYAKEKGMGIGTKVLSFLETKAQELGYSIVRLETRLVNQGAVSFYENRGYYRIPNYGKYVNRLEAVCFEKNLVKDVEVEKLDKLELVIFDMDGLMFDTEKIAFLSWKKAASEYGYVIDREIFNMTVGVNLEGTKEIYRTHFGEKFPIENIKNERFKLAEESIKKDGVPIKKGLNELLEYLKKGNIRRAVATSTSRERAIMLLKMAGIDRCFDYIICGDDIENSKPHPEIFIKVADKLGCLPQNCIVLEDSEVGIVAANRAQMVPIMIPDMKEPSEEIKKIVYKQLNSLFDVKTFIEDVLWDKHK